MLVATGRVGTSLELSNTVEYIDLSSSTKRCIGVGSNTLPAYLLGAVGGVGVGGLPKICGGRSGSGPSLIGAAVTNACNLLNITSKVWTGTTALPNAVESAAASTSPYPSAAIFVTGGSGAYGTLYASSQSLANLAWTPKPSLPIPLAGHCQVQLTTTTVLVIGGATNSNNLYSRATYILNTVTNTWTAGPQLAIGRNSHSCARILTDGAPNKYSTIVVGGLISPGTTASVEILDDGATAWRAGPSFPMGINSMFFLD